MRDRGSLNKVILVGRLGKDPEIRYLPSGEGERALARFTLATTLVYKKEGVNQEITEWHSVYCWGSLAKFARDYLRKGKQVLVEGRLRTRRWEQDGQVRRVTEIEAEKIILLGKKEETAPEEFPSEPPDFSGGDDEVPF